MAIEDEIRSALSKAEFSGAASTIVDCDLLKRAIAEIEFLRSRAGAMTDGPSMAQLKRQQGPQKVDE